MKSEVWAEVWNGHVENERLKDKVRALEELIARGEFKPTLDLLNEEKNMSFKTTQDILRALADGEKVRHREWPARTFVYASGYGITDDRGNFNYNSFEQPDAWELYSEPKKKVKWYRAVRKSDNGRPWIADGLYRSEADAKNIYGSDFLTLLPDPIELEDFSDSTKGDT